MNRSVYVCVCLCVCFCVCFCVGARARTHTHTSRACARTHTRRARAHTHTHVSQARLSRQEPATYFVQESEAVRFRQRVARCGRGFGVCTPVHTPNVEALIALHAPLTNALPLRGVLDVAGLFCPYIRSF